MSSVVRYLYGVLNIFILSFFHVILVSRNVDGLISVVSLCSDARSLFLKKKLVWLVFLSYPK